ncbi:MAG: thioredoxin family protein [Elusimicrobia bacterium]|nr:thioredoxin family protein [Elusimicrobiota bacterium]
MSIAAAIALAYAVSAHAGTWEPYTDGGFNAAMDRGRPVVLQFTAQGCGICADQERVITRILRQPEFKDFAGFSVDFDAFRPVVARWRVGGRSTLLLLRERQEIRRVAGIITESDILGFLKHAMPDKLRGRPKKRPSNRLEPRP